MGEDEIKEQETWLADKQANDFFGELKDYKPEEVKDEKAHTQELYETITSQDDGEEINWVNAEEEEDSVEVG